MWQRYPPNGHTTIIHTDHESLQYLATTETPAETPCKIKRSAAEAWREDQPLYSSLDPLGYDLEKAMIYFLRDGIESEDPDFDDARRLRQYRQRHAVQITGLTFSW